MDTNQISLQLYTVREKAGQDLDATLKQIADIGYKYVEPAGFYGLSAADLKAKFDQYGLHATSAHIPYAQFQEDAAKAFADMKTLGIEYGIVPYLTREQRDSREKCEQLAANLNQWGKQAQAEGLKFGYHNHNFEFEPVDGTTLWDVLLEQTDPALVCLELDLFWATKGGNDALELLKKYPGRFPLLHMKDITGSEPLEDLPVGEGVLPWEQILEQARATDTKWYVVEMDKPREVFDDIRTSFNKLREL